MSVSIVWFRNDLRLSDNPALVAAVESGRAVLPVFVLDEETDGIRPRGAASRWWLHHSLNALDESLRKLGSRLVLRRGPAEKEIADLVARSEAQAVYWNRLYDQGSRDRDDRLKTALARRGVTVETFKANLLFEPEEISTQGGNPFKVFTPFWRACRKLPSADAPCPRRRRCRRRTAGRKANHSMRGACCRRRRTGRAACEKPGHPARRAPRRRSRTFSTTRSRIIAARTTCRLSRAHRASPRTSPSARSVHGRSGEPPPRTASRPPPRSSCRRSAGASSPTISSFTSGTCRSAVSGPSSTPFPG